MKDLLDLAMMENNTFKQEVDCFSMYDVIQNSFEVIKSLAAEKWIELVGPCEDTVMFGNCFRNLYGD